MALTSTISYCEDQDVIDIYPRIDQFDLKRKLTSNWAGGTTTYYYYNSGNVSRLFKNGVDLGTMEEDAGQVDRPDEWHYNAADDTIILNESTINGGTDPNLDLFEAGDIWEDLIERFRLKASRLIESKLGSTISREILKDREGNYPASIIQATALKTAILLITAHNPHHNDLIPLTDEYDDIIGKIQSGRIIMTGHRSDNDSKGLLRYAEYDPDVYLSLYNIYPVELSGNYTGNNYELLYLYFIGFTEPDHALYKELIYCVKGKSSTKLVDKLLIDETLINFDYQDLGVGNLKVRFSTGEIPRAVGEFHHVIGDLSEYVSGSGLTIPVIYEIELWGDDVSPTVSQVQSIQLTKRDMLWH